MPIPSHKCCKFIISHLLANLVLALRISKCYMFSVCLAEEIAATCRTEAANWEIKRIKNDETHVTLTCSNEADKSLNFP